GVLVVVTAARAHETEGEGRAQDDRSIHGFLTFVDVVVRRDDKTVLCRSRRARRAEVRLRIVRGARYGASSGARSAHEPDAPVSQDLHQARSLWARVRERRAGDARVLDAPFTPGDAFHVGLTRGARAAARAGNPAACVPT